MRQAGGLLARLSDETVDLSGVLRRLQVRSGELVERDGGFFGSGGLAFGTLAQLFGCLGDVIDVVVDRLLRLVRRSVEVTAQALVVLGELLRDGAAEITLGQRVGGLGRVGVFIAVFAPQVVVRLRD